MFFFLVLLGSDLSICVTDALLQPIRELEHATHWKIQSDNMEFLSYTPCKEGDEESRKCTLKDLPPHQVQKNLGR